MCGINGIINLDGEKVSKNILELMNKTIMHRGPDDKGIFIDKNIGLGHVRLSIIDLSKAGHQPMQYEHKKRTVTIIFNGEVYNFQEIRTELEKEGYQFKSRTDTEVVLAAYLEWDVKCLEKFNGMFSFAIYDKSKGRIFGARDRFGKKPFKYYIDNEKFIFSSELKAILLNNIPRKPDFEAIDQYLTLQYVPAPLTGFDNIYKLPNAHYFIFDINKKSMKIEKYWDLDYSKKKKLSKKKWQKAIERKLEESVKRRLISDVPLGAFLSGGVDSSAIVAFMSKFTDKVKTFSIGFKEKDFDETKYARKVAKRYNTEHKELIVKSSDFLKLIDKLVYQYEEPYADSSQLPTFILAEFTKKYVTVALNGDGGDENFGGYDKYARHLIAEPLWIPFNKQISKIFSFIDKRIKSSLFMHKVYIFLQTLNKPGWARHYTYTHYFDVFSKNEFYKDDFKKKLMTKNKFESIVKGKKFDAIDKIFYLDFNSYVPDDLMVKVDIATMANSLESRSPLLDYEFVELAASMPRKYKIKLFGGRKILFKKMLEKYLSKDIMYRKKKGFGVPIVHWFRKDLKNEMRKTLLDKEGIVLTIMKEDKVRNLIRQHLNGKDNSKKLWALLILNKWYETFLKTEVT